MRSPIFSGVALSVANILDAITTYLSLTKPCVSELNPFMRYLIAKSWVHFFSMKLGASVFFVLTGVYVASIISRGKITEKLARVCVFIMLLLAVGLFYASWHNFHLYLRW